MSARKYIAILRGINVSGKNKIKMVDLRSFLGKEGLKNITTYIQSGNIIFEHEEGSITTLENKISEAITKNTGFDVPVLVLTPEELEKAASVNPFIKRGENIKSLHLTILAKEPGGESIDKIKEYNYPPDEFVISGRFVYVFCPNGYGRTKLNNTFFENKLKVNATTRNRKTVEKLISLAGE